MLGFASVVSTWSRCPEGRQHGCVLAVDGKYLISTGFNDTARGQSACECEGKPKDFCSEVCRAVHAEVNAVINAAHVGAQLDRCVAFCTKKPCGPCLSVLRNARVREVWYGEPEVAVIKLG
jgi:dCMP deaminase